MSDEPQSSNWDRASDSGSEAEVIGTIHTSDEPWFDVDQHYVVREPALEEALVEFEDENPATLVLP
jgi:hypothetical protein